MLQKPSKTAPVNPLNQWPDLTDLAIPEGVRYGTARPTDVALNLTEGSRLTPEVRGPEIVLSREATWKKLQGAAGDLMQTFAAFKRQEREREDSRP